MTGEIPATMAAPASPWWRTGADLVTVGVFAVGLAMVFRQRLDLATVGLVALAAILDGLDGWMARRAGGSSRYGPALDLVADWTAFGLGPAASAVARFGAGNVLILMASVLYVVAALYRLTRHVLARHAGRQGFAGMPMPADGLSVVVLALLVPDARLVVLGIILVSLLAVSGWRYPDLPWLWSHVRQQVLVTLLLMLVVAWRQPLAALLVGCLAYAGLPLWSPREP